MGNSKVYSKSWLQLNDEDVCVGKILTKVTQLKNGYRYCIVNDGEWISRYQYIDKENGQYVFINANTDDKFFYGKIAMKVLLDKEAIAFENWA